MSLAGISSLFESFSSYNPLEIKGALNTLTSAALQKGNGSFSIQTDAFSLESKTLGTEPLVLPRLSLPSLGLPSGSFASTIQWTTNPYDQSSNPVVSVSALSKNASEISIHSLSTPFTTRWTVAPTIYTFFCDQGIVLLNSSSTYTSVPNITRLTPTTWSVPCGSFFTNVSCPIQSYTCPTAECVYWNTSLSTWTSDGCVREIAGSDILCHCTHMTDFSVRMQNIASENVKVFAIASSVYSEEGLVLYAKWYGIFGALGIMTIFLFSIATWLDFPIRRLYVDWIMKNKKFKPILERAPLTPVYRYNNYSSLQMYRPLDSPSSVREDKLNPCRRMCVQHSYFQAILRYDPRLSRSFRTLFLILMQFNSLFATALLYGFSFGSKKDLDASDTILLSLLTALVTVPCLRIGLYYLNTVGLKEFEYQFPMLYDEYMRRVDFEDIASALYQQEKKEESTLSDDIMDMTQKEEEEESILLRLLNSITICKKVEEKEVIVEERSVVLKKLAACIQRDYPKFPTYGPSWELLPCHTLHGWMFLLISFGWIGWCLQYLLLFAAANSSSVGDGILTSFGSAELVTIFLSQPFSILMSTIVLIVLHKYKRHLPWPLSMLGSVTTKNSIPSMYFYGNPLNHHTHTVLSSEFAHTIFMDAASKASGIDIFSTAPIKSILSSINKEEETPDRRIEELYYSMVNYYTKTRV